MKNKLTARELSSFCGQMGMLLHSGISTAEGLHILCDESKTDADRQILTPLIRSVEENGSLSRALDESEMFPTSMTAYVRTGEETGCLDEIMESLSSHYAHAWHDGCCDPGPSDKSPAGISTGI